jgi:surface antigen
VCDDRRAHVFLRENEPDAAMMLSRRLLTRSFVAFAASGLAMLDAVAARADRHLPPNTAITAKGALRLALTDEDNVQRARCVRWTMNGPAGKTWSWRNRRSGNRGTMKPTGKPERVAGRNCRSFNETIILKDGRSETVDGRACQKADGSWEVVA